MADDSKLSINWFTDNTTDPENPTYNLYCEDKDPKYSELHVSIAASAVTERAARAKLIEAMFQKARDLGIDTSRLRFHV